MMAIFKSIVEAHAYSLGSECINIFMDKVTSGGAEALLHT